MFEFNPKKIEKTVISIRIQENILEEIDTLAHQRDISRNELILQCINFSLKHISNNESNIGDKSNFN